MEARLISRLQDVSPPSELEKTRFFRGLTSQPQLVARTGQAWSDSDIGPLCKFLCPFPLGHPFVRKWNPAESTLRASIVQQLTINKIDWAAIDAVGKYLRPPFSEGSTPTLLITVPPGSTKWEVGVRAVNACKIILEDHGIKDMEVEMKTGTIYQMASDFSDCPENIEECMRKESLLAARTGLIGLPIGARGTTTQGTLGLHLTLRGGNGKRTRLALSCRHVFFQGDDTHEHLHGRDDAVIAVSPNELQLEKAIEEASKMVKEEHDEVTRLEIRIAQRYGDDEAHVPKANRQYLASVKNSLEKSRWVETKLKELQGDGAERCKLGHVLYSPPIAEVPGPSPSARPWYPDWALIQIGDHRTEEELENNWCYVGSPLLFKKELNVATRLAGITIPSALVRATMREPQKQYIELKSATIPENELYGLPSVEQFGELEPSDKLLVVFKHGMKTGFTAGFANTPKSVKRSDGYVSEEWCILPFPREIFSEPSDSGSCVWDTERRIGGIIIAGCGNEAGKDTTYATPIERLLTDIRRRGYHVELPLSAEEF